MKIQLIAKFCCGISVFLCAQTMSLAQSQPQQLTFEVASVRRVVEPRPGETGVGVVREDSAQVSYRGITLKSLLMRAYHLKPFQVNGPSWLDSERYDVLAKLPAGASKDQAQAMLRTLIQERFRLTMHWEAKQQPVYVLVTDRNGAKLTPSTTTAARDGTEDGEASSAKSVSLSSNGRVTIIGASMPMFVDILSRFLDRPVVDSTGLQGKFDIILNVSMADLFAAQSMHSSTPDASPSFSTSTSSVFTAVRELGLRLDAHKEEVRHMVVENATKDPGEN